MQCLYRPGDCTNSIQCGANCAVNDVENILNTPKQTELAIRRRRKCHADREGRDQRHSNHSPPIARPTEKNAAADYSKENSTHCVALLRPLHADLTAPDASSGSSGSSARPFGKSRASSR